MDDFIYNSVESFKTYMPDCVCNYFEWRDEKARELLRVYGHSIWDDISIKISKKYDYETEIAKIIFLSEMDEYKFNTNSLVFYCGEINMTKLEKMIGRKRMKNFELDRQYGVRYKVTGDNRTIRHDIKISLGYNERVYSRETSSRMSRWLRILNPDVGPCTIEETPLWFLYDKYTPLSIKIWKKFSEYDFN